MLPAFRFLLKTDFFSVYNSKRRKTRKSNRAFDQYQHHFFIWNSKYKHTTKKFIHSYILILKQQTWKCKIKCILCWLWNIFAMSIFETLGQGLQVWNGLPPFLDLTPIKLFPPNNIEIFSPLPPHNSVFWRLHPRPKFVMRGSNYAALLKN